MRVLIITVLSCLAASCSRDLELPQAPLSGSVRGGLDVSPWLSPSGLEVVLLSREGARTATTTDADGGFVFSPVAPGDYAVSTQPPGFAPLERSFVHVAPGATFDLGVLQPVWRGGVVGVSGKLTVQGGGDPTGAQLEFLLLPQRRRVALTTVGQSGEFIERVAPGEYELKATHPLYVSTTVTPPRFEDGSDVLLDPIVLAVDPATLTGRVMKEVDGAAPVPAAGVLVTIEPVGATSVTAGDGTFTLTGLSAGERRVQFTLGDFHDASALHTVSLSPGAASTVPDALLLLDRGDVVGEVVLADRQPATGISVGIVAARKATAVVQDNTEPWKGTFTLSGVPVGSWEVTVTRQGYSRATRGGVPVTRDRAADVGTLTLTKLQGDFLIEDADTSNTNGYTRSPAVTLQLTGFTGAADFRVSEDPAFPSVTWAPFTGTAQPFTLTTTQGTHTVYAQYRDANGTESPVFVSTIVFDSLPPSMPEVIINDGVDFSARAQPLSLRLVAVDTAPGVVDQVSGIREVRLSESATVDANGRLVATPRPYVRDDLFTRSSSADGPVRLHAQFFDHAGNQTAVVFDDVVIDTVDPVGALTIRRGARATDDGYTNTERVTLDLLAPDGGVPSESNGGPLFVKLAKTQPALAGAPVLALSGVMLHELDAEGADGPREVWFVLRDAAGNETSPAMQGITLDRTPPTVTAFSLGVTSPTRAITFPLTWTASDTFGFSSTAAFTASEDPFFQGPGTVGPLALPPGNTTSFTPSAGDGSRAVSVRFRDHAGNEAFASARTEVDRTAPTGSFQLEGRLADNTVSQTYTSVPNITALIFSQGATEVFVGDESTSACPSSGYVAAPANGRLPVTLSGALGPRTVKLCLRDAALNVSDLLLANITYETAAPTGCLLSAVGYRADTGTAPVGRTARPILSVSLNGCSSAPAEWVVVEGAVTCSLPGLAWERYAPNSFALRGADGARQLNTCIRSESRNVATLAPVTMDLDSTAPLGPTLVLDSNAAWVNLAAYQARGNVFSASALGSVTGALEWALSETTTFSTWLTLGSTNPRTWTFPGTGARRLYAIFRDDLGNTSPPVSDDITFDIVAPTTTGLSLSLVTNSPDPAFVATGNFALSVASAPPADAASALVAQVATSTLCTAAGVFSGSLPRPVEASIGVVGVGGDGAKRVCVAWLDAAGNASAPLTANLTVDTTPPSPPELATANALVSLPNGTTYGVDLVRPVIESNFLRAEIRGGTLSTWTATSATSATTHFDYTLSSNAGLENVTNTLQLRVVDRAGNVGPSSEVQIITDVKAPQPPTLTTQGVSNLNGAGTLFWAAPTDTDLARLLVDYGPASGQLNGTVATEGVSPIEVPANATQQTLNGLVNGSRVYAQLRAQDRAGNVSGPSTEVTLQPNVMSLTLAAETDLSASPMREITDLEVDGDVLYAVGTDVTCYNFFGGPTTPTETVLVALDLATVRSPTQAGRLEPATQPATLWSLRLPEAQTQSDCMSVASDLLIDGTWAYLAVNQSVRIFRLGKRGTAPALVTTLTLPWAVRTLSLTGNVLFANGANGIMAIDVASLNDEAAGTKPSTSTPVGTLTPTSTYSETSQFVSTGVAVTRNRFVQFARTESTGAKYWNVADALDSNAGTAWNDSDYVGTVDSASWMWLFRAPIVSGNLAFAFYDSKLQSRDLKGLWSGTPVTLPAVMRYSVGSSFAMGGPVALSGSGAWAIEENGDSIYSFDLRGGSGGQASLGGRFQVDPTRRLRSLKTWGPYLIAGTRTGQVQFFEIATPRGMRPVQQLPYGSPHYVFDGPLAFGTNGSVLDLQGNTVAGGPVELGPVSQVYTSSNPYDLQDVAVFGDETVSAFAGDGKLRVHNVQKMNDRDPATVAGIVPFTDGYDVALPGVLRVLQVEAWGSALIALEYRADGVWLEAFDATAVRDGNPATQLTPGASKGSVRIGTELGSIPDATMMVRHGRAFVSLSFNGSPLVNNSVRAWDFRNLFDDDVTTVGFVNQGTLPIDDARTVVVVGTRAYVTKVDGLTVWDVSAAMDDSPATLLSATAPLASLALDQPYELIAYGTRLFAANHGTGFQARSWALDFSNLAAPRISSLAFVGTQSGGVSGPNGQIFLRGALQVSGEYLYIGGGVDTFAQTTVIALE